MTAFLFAAVNHRECEEMSKLSEMTTFQAVPWCPAADTHVGMSWRGCLSRERLCDLSGGQTGNHIRLFPRSPSLTSLVRPLWGKSILGNGHAGFTFVPKQTSSFFLSYWKCPKRLTDLKGKQILISHICNLSPSPESGQQVAAESHLSCPNRSHLRCTPRPLVTVHNSDGLSSLSL